MKKEIIPSAFLPFSSSLAASLVSFKKLSVPKAGDPAPLVFWTANRNYGPIEIFVDNVYQGTITESYSGIPACASNGCVTVMITGTEWFHAQTKDGKYKWQSWKHETLATRCMQFGTAEVTPFF